MNVATFPPFLLPATPPAADNPFLGLAEQVGKAYSAPIQGDLQELWLSSMRIVGEHTARALAKASQDCVAALTQNAAGIQQRSMLHLWEANQQAFSLIAGAYTKGATTAFQPFGAALLAPFGSR
jgi:hypothetical protein